MSSLSTHSPEVIDPTGREGRRDGFLGPNDRSAPRCEGDGCRALYTSLYLACACPVTEP